MGHWDIHMQLQKELGGGGGYLGILRIKGKKFKKRERYSSLSEKDTRGKGTVQMDRAPEMSSDDRSG